MTGIMTLLSEMSSQAVWLGLDVAAKATVVLLLAVAVNRLLNGRVLARAAVWNALLVGLILLPPATALFPRLRICCLPPTPTAATVEIPAESPPPAETAVPDEVLPAPSENEDPSPSPVAADLRVGRSPMEISPDAVDPESIGPQEEPMVGVGDPSYIAPNPATSSPRRPGVIVCVYLLGVAILALRLTFSFLAVRRLRGQSVPLEDSKWTAALAAWRERLGIRQAVQLGVSSAVNVPIQIGWLRPMVILPAEMIAALEPARHGSILLHELAHVRRRDYAWQILLKLVQIIYWPHPLIWLAGRMIGANREQVCDDLCVHHSSSAGQYRATLLEVASVLVRRPAASLGIAMARTSKIGGRLERIDRGCRLSRCLARWPVRLAIVAIVLAGACMIAPVKLAHRTAASPDADGGPPATRPADGSETTAAELQPWSVLKGDWPPPLPRDALIGMWLAENDDDRSDKKDRALLLLADNGQWAQASVSGNPRAPLEITCRATGPKWETVERDSSQGAGLRLRVDASDRAPFLAMDILRVTANSITTDLNPFLGLRFPSQKYQRCDPATVDAIYTALVRAISEYNSRSTVISPPDFNPVLPLRGPFVLPPVPKARPPHVEPWPPPLSEDTLIGTWVAPGDSSGSAILDLRLLILRPDRTWARASAWIGPNLPPYIQDREDGREWELLNVHGKGNLLGRTQLELKDAPSGSAVLEVTGLTSTKLTLDGSGGGTYRRSEGTHKESLEAAIARNTAITQPAATRPFATTQEATPHDPPYKTAATKPAPVTATKPAPLAEGPTRVLDVRVVHMETGEPIADAEAVFNFEGEPQVTLKIDSGGRCQFRYPDRPGHHGLNVQKAGLLSLSYWGDRVNSIPPNLTFKMEPGVGIGGFVKNSQGQPVAKAEVKVGVGSTRQEQLTGIRVNTYHEPVATDERGHWEVTGVPSDLSRLHVTAKHPDYLYRELSPGTGLPVGQLLDKSAVIVLDKGIEVTGRLIDEDGKPITELPVLGTETDQDGRFRAVGIEPSNQGLLIKVPGYLAHSVGTRIYAGMPPLEIRLQRAITVRGRVTDTAGNPVKSTHISTQLQEWRDTRVSPHGPLARTDADGRFVLHDMRPDKWVLRIYDNNYRWFEHELTLTRGEAPAELHLVLQPTILGTIRGIVLAKDGVTPVAGAIIGDDHNRTSDAGTATDQAGRFELSGLRPQKYTYWVRGKGYAPVSFTAEVAADGTSAEQRIVLDRHGGTIAGRGFDTVANAPLADEVIVACAQDYPGIGIASHLRGSPSTLADLERHRFHGIHYRTQTGKDGSYQLANLPEGFYTVCLIRRSSTRHLWKELVHVGEGDVTTEVDLTVKPEPAAAVKEAEPPPRPADKPAPGPAGSLSGIVYLPDGKTPAKGIKVAPYTKDRNRHNMLRNKIVITSAEGAFSFDGLAAGRYGVYAWLLEDNGSSREDLPTPPPAELSHVVPTLSSLVQVKAGQATTEVKVTLKEGAVVRGTVTDADNGQPMTGAWVSIDDNGAEYILFVRVSDPRNPFDLSPSRRTFTDAQGRYAFYCMPAQRYRLSADTQHDKHDQVNLDSFTLKKGEDRTIDVQLQPARYGTLAGRVFMPDGRPAAGAEVCIGSLSNKTVADGQGRYRAERVRVHSDPHTSPSIFARAENTALTSVRAPKMKPAQTVPFDIRLLAGGTVTGRVTRADGSPPKDGTLACLMRVGGPNPEWSYRDVLKPENRWEHFWVRVESDGSYRLEHIPPNKYHLFALSDDKPHNIVKDLNIKDGATLKKDLKLSP